MPVRSAYSETCVIAGTHRVPLASTAHESVPVHMMPLPTPWAKRRAQRKEVRPVDVVGKQRGEHRIEERVEGGARSPLRRWSIDGDQPGSFHLVPEWRG